MLAEVLRARSQDILDNLRAESIDLVQLRRLALHMRLSTDDLIQGAGLIKRGQMISAKQNTPVAEPASVQSVLELCSIATRYRLAELGIEFEAPKAPQDHFVNSNPWELAYALFLIIQCAAQAFVASQSSESVRHRRNQWPKIPISIAVEDGFVDISIASFSTFDPNFPSPESEKDAGVLNQVEWLCFKALIESNNAHLHVQLCKKELGIPYCIVMRLPTFQPGHEEPLHFLRASEQI